MTTILKQRREFVTPKQFGAVGDCRAVWNTNCTAGSNVVTNTTDAPFMPSDVGAPIWLSNGGGANGILAATVTGYTSASQVTISANASFTQAGIRCVVGHDDTAAIAAAIAYCTPRAGFMGGSALYLGDGHYLTGPQTTPMGLAIYGNGPFQSMLYLKPQSTGTNKFLLRNVDSYANRQSYEDFGLNGLGYFQGSGQDVDVLVWKNGIGGVFPTLFPILDVYNRYRNLFIWEANRGGLVYAGRGESKFTDLTILSAGVCGFDLNAYDNAITGVHASAYGPAFFIHDAAGSNRFANCKGFFSGQQSSFANDGYGAGMRCNWFVYNCYNNDFVNCEGQESWGSNWHLQDTHRNTFTSCRGADPGCLYPADGQGGDNSAAVRAGWRITGSSTDNRFANCAVSIGTHGSSSYASHGVYLDGTADYNRGEFALPQNMTFATAASANTTSGTHNALTRNGTTI